MVIDFASGISKQYVLNPGEITSHRAWIGIMKKAWTLVSVIVVALMLSAL
jgi:phage-related holin